MRYEKLNLLSIEFDIQLHIKLGNRSILKKIGMQVEDMYMFKFLKN